MPVESADATPRRPVQVLRVQHGAPTVVLFLANAQGHLEHWIGRKTAPCPGVEKCPPVVHRNRPVYYAYAPVAAFDLVSGRILPAVLQLTANLEEQLRARELRGEVWSLTRRDGKGKTAAVDATFVEKRDTKSIPKPFPILPPLLRLFGADSLLLGVPNPSPAPLVIDVFEVEPLNVASPAPELQGTPLTRDLLDKLKATSSTPGVRYH